MHTDAEVLYFLTEAEFLDAMGTKLVPNLQGKKWHEIMQGEQ